MKFRAEKIQKEDGAHIVDDRWLLCNRCNVVYGKGEMVIDDVNGIKRCPDCYSSIAWATEEEFRKKYTLTEV